jgi:hypothetical protein
MSFGWTTGWTNMTDCLTNVRLTRRAPMALREQLQERAFAD